MNKWHGDWVWPTNIIAGIAWSFGFLVAGALNYFLGNSNLTSIQLKLIYIAVLWIWGLIVWLVVLLIGYKK